MSEFIYLHMYRYLSHFFSSTVPTTDRHKVTCLDRTCLFTLSLTNLAIFFLGPSGIPISFRSSTVHMSWKSVRQRDKVKQQPPLYINEIWRITSKCPSMIVDLRKRYLWAFLLTTKHNNKQRRLLFLQKIQCQSSPHQRYSCTQTSPDVPAWQKDPQTPRRLLWAPLPQLEGGRHYFPVQQERPPDVRGRIYSYIMQHYFKMMHFSLHNFKELKVFLINMHH